MSKTYTVIIDGLPEGFSTYQLFAAFIRHGSILRAWRSHGDQGLVTYSDMKSALKAVEEEHGQVWHYSKITVTAAFFNSSDPLRPGWWQCSLCRHWNQQDQHSPQVCHGYMCGVEKTEGGIADLERQVSSQEAQQQQQQGSYSTEEVYTPQNDADAQQQGYSQAAGPGQYQQQQQQQQHPSGGHSPSMHEAYYNSTAYTPASQHPDAAAQHAGSPYEAQSPYEHDPQQQQQQQQQQHQQQPPQQDTGVPQQQQQMPGGQQAAPYFPNPGELVPIPPPPPPGVGRHCVVISNVPNNITDRTLCSVFGKYKGGGIIQAWVKPGGRPRALCEGQVVFDCEQAARDAVEGESGQLVDGQNVWCTYAEELFVITVRAIDREMYMWNSYMSDAEKEAEVVNGLSQVFQQYGPVNSVSVVDRIMFIEFYSCASMLDALHLEDGNSRSCFTLSVQIAASGTRWPCMQHNCLRVNPSYVQTCEACHTPRQRIDSRHLREVIYQTMSDEPAGQTVYQGDSYRGYCSNLKPYYGANLKKGGMAGAGQPPDAYAQGAPAQDYSAHSPGMYQQQQQQQQQQQPPQQQQSGMVPHDVPPTAHRDGYAPDANVRAHTHTHHSSDMKRLDHNSHGHWGGKGGGGKNGWGGKGKGGGSGNGYNQRNGYRNEFQAFNGRDGGGSGGGGGGGKGGGFRQGGAAGVHNYGRRDDRK